jgi:cell division protein FtsL
MTVTTPPGSELRKTAPPPRVRRYRQMPAPDPQPRWRISSAIIYIVVAVLIAAVGLLYLIQTNHVAGLGYEMSQLQRERAALSLRNEQLIYSIASYESITQVESIAIGQLGMQQSDDYLFLSVQRPSSDQLAMPEAQSPATPSMLQRVWNGITGSATKVAPNPESGP